MSLALYSTLALPLWGAMFALYFILRRAGLKKESLVAKCAGSFLAVGSAGLALWLGGRNPLFHPVFWFFALCTAADALLERDPELESCPAAAERMAELFTEAELTFS